MFFRKTRKMSDGVLSVLRAKFDAVFGKLSPNLKSFFGDVFSQDKASKPPLYMHTARRKKRSIRETQPETSNHFSAMFFSQDKASKPPLYVHTARRKKRRFTGNSARISNHFSVMFFRKTRKISADVQAYFKRNLTQYSGNSARTSNHFSAMFFSQDKASKPPLYMHTARRKKRSIAEKQPEKSDFHNVGFLFLCHIVNFFNVFVGYLLNFVLTVVELVFGYGFIFVELF